MMKEAQRISAADMPSNFLNVENEMVMMITRR